MNEAYARKQIDRYKVSVRNADAVLTMNCAKYLKTENEAVCRCNTIRQTITRQP